MTVVLGRAKGLSSAPPKGLSPAPQDPQNVGMPKTLGARVTQAREERGLSQIGLAKAAGLSNATISELERDVTEKPKLDTLLKVAHALKKDITYFTGKREANTTGAGENVLLGRVPLISWVQAGKKQAVIDAYQPGAADEWEEYAVPVSKNAFALRVRGDSMTPDFPEGTIIIIDPEVPAKSGDYVVVRFQDTDEATFKRLIVDGPSKILRPLNTAYPTIEITEDARLCGVVVEANLRRKFR